jgi:thiamine-monophosphate kinase
MTEFAFIERIRARIQRQPADLLLGIGDDAAILNQTAGRELLITTDLLVEDIDFKLEYIPPAWLGHKALAISLSDIAAMGGVPRFSLLTLAIPRPISNFKFQNSEDFWNEFLDGYFALAEKHQVALVGGDISGMPERLAIDSVVLGHCASGQSIRRSGARAGDAIFVTGELGAAALGLRLLLAGERVNESVSDWRQQALRAHLRPEPRVAFGQQLGGLASAMLDASDGLSQDLSHLCEASRVSAVLDAETIPIAACAQSQPDVLQLALAGGEDFELLFTAAPAHETALQQLAASSNLVLTRIGEIIAPRQESTLWLHQSGKTTPLAAIGFDHFAV